MFQRDSTANIVQRQIASALLSRTLEDVIMVFQSCLAAKGQNPIDASVDFGSWLVLPSVMDELDPFGKEKPLALRTTFRWRS